MPSDEPYILKVLLFEVEDRPVLLREFEDQGFACVWSRGTWRDAPGLVAKALFFGERLTLATFKQRFPDADLATVSLFPA